MKPQGLLLLSLTFLFSLILSAQKSKTIETSKASTSTNINSKDIENLPLFSRSMNSFTIQRNFDFTTTKPSGSNAVSGHTNNLDLNIDYDYFIQDHLGIGLDFDLSSSSQHYGSTDKTTQWLLSPNVIYGANMSNNFNLYGKASVGFGQTKTEYGGSTQKENLFGYKIEVGAPLHMFGDGGNYLTPYLSYDFQQEKFNSTTTKDNEFTFGLKFQNYSPCSGYTCDMHSGCMQSRTAYQQGRSYIGYTTMGEFGFGTSKYDYNGTTSTTDLSGGQLELEYGYYLLNYIAIGAEFNWVSQTSKVTGTKYTNSALIFTPMVTLNMPVQNCWSNLFLQGGYGFGQDKSTSNSSSSKENLSAYGFGLGYNDFFGKHIAFTPKIGYFWETIKDPSTNTEEKWKSFEWSMGVTLHF